MANGQLLVEQDDRSVTVPVSSPTRAAVEHLLSCLCVDAPQTGAVCVLTHTERQFAFMRHLMGVPDGRSAS